MLFGSKKKDEEIERLKRRIEELENQKNDEDLLLNELNEVVQKLGDPHKDKCRKAKQHNIRLRTVFVHVHLFVLS